MDLNLIFLTFYPFSSVLNLLKFFFLNILTALFNIKYNIYIVDIHFRRHLLFKNLYSVSSDVFAESTIIYNKLQLISTIWI